MTALIFRFIDNCRAHRRNQVKAIHNYPCLSVQELVSAENYWILISQEDYFKKEIHALTSNKALPSKGCLLSLHPFLDSSGILRVRGREQNSKLSCSNLHPVILHGKHPVTKLIIHTEHLRFFLFFSMKVYAKEQGIQDSIANGQYPKYKDTNRQNEKEANNKVKLIKVWI